MKIALITMIKNEADILETFIRFHAGFADRIIVVDHRSMDSSTEIVRQLMSEGLPIELQSESRVEHVQSEVMTRLMRDAAESGADWILPLDADEFLVSTRAKVKVREVLAATSSSRPLRVPWRNYVPDEKDDPSETVVPRRITHRLPREIKQRYKVLVPCSLASRPDVSLRQGNHGLLRGNGRGFKGGVNSELLALAHFPVRSDAQITSKAFAGWLTTLAKADRKENEALHWKALFDRAKMNEPLSISTLREIALNYLQIDSEGRDSPLIHDPITMPASFSLKFLENNRCNPVHILAQTAEEVISDLSRFKGDERNQEKSFWRRVLG